MVFSNNGLNLKELYEEIDAISQGSKQGSRVSSKAHQRNQVVPLKY